MIQVNKLLATELCHGPKQQMLRRTQVNTQRLYALIADHLIFCYGSPDYPASFYKFTSRRSLHSSSRNNLTNDSSKQKTVFCSCSL